MSNPTSNLTPPNEVHPQLISRRVKTTSKTAFVDFIHDGLLAGQRKEVYDLLKAKGPLTGRELDAMLSTVSAHKRLSELERLGAVRVQLKRVCTVSGRNVEAWEAIDPIPATPSAPAAGAGPVSQGMLGL